MFMIFKGRCVNEAVRSSLVYPFTKETLSTLNFHVQLANFHRYDQIHVTIFIESNNLREDDDEPDRYPQGVSLPRMYNVEGWRTLCYVAAFRGMFCFNRGTTFPLAGGRIYMNLKPILTNSINLSNAEFRRLQFLDEISLIVSFMPIAIPSAKFINVLLDKNIPAPVYPSCLIDGNYYYNYKVIKFSFF